MKYCTLCGIPFTRRLNDDWIEKVRAVWIEGNNWNRTAVSGVGRWGEFDDIPSVTVPTNPRIRDDDESGPPTTREVDLTPDDPTLCTDPGDEDIAWGYGFHESCWSIFTKDYTPNLDALFSACLSTPTGATTLLDWGHDYGGAAKIEQMFDMPVRTSCYRSPQDIPHVFRSDPYHIPGLIDAIQGAVRLQIDAFLSRLEPTMASLKSDSFSRLVPEVLQSIVILLPTSDVRSLRLASPVFATLELPERFWASRFQPGHELDYLPEVHDQSPQSWRAFYHSLKIWTRGIPSMANRQRVWGLAKRLQATLTQMDGVACQGSPLGTWHENIPDGPDHSTSEAVSSWHAASRAVVNLGDSFFYGSRVLRTRALHFPEPMRLRQISVSFVDTAAGKFISGLTLIDSHGRSYAVGYQHENTISRILLPDEPIRGWELAMDLPGITGIAAVYCDGTLSSWAGESVGIPRWRLEGTQAVSAVKADFDASFSPRYIDKY
ncbi:hypothetical protein FMEXI_5839 [Fusarium mexicanum]|uniref:DUF7600 domain-containing protein n=1 Tax=Fusarium mexicanum TaxID=751941 RepID=A0A8H5IZ24_9HYPO|nr:hypothetical protein FMEXI_5839 [Fusarium mexicanum]